MKACADRVPEDKIFMVQCWDRMLREIIYHQKDVIDHECEVAIECSFYGHRRKPETLFSHFLTDVNKRKGK